MVHCKCTTVPLQATVTATKLSFTSFIQASIIPTWVPRQSKEERDSHHLVYKAVYKSIPPLEGKGWMRGPMDVACRWLWTLIPNGSWSEWSQVLAGHAGMWAKSRTIKAARELFLLSLTFWTQETGLPVSWLTQQRGLCPFQIKTTHKSRIEEGYRWEDDKKEDYKYKKVMGYEHIYIIQGRQGW